MRDGRALRKGSRLRLGAGSMSGTGDYTPGVEASRPARRAAGPVLAQPGPPGGAEAYSKPSMKIESTQVTTMSETSPAPSVPLPFVMLQDCTGFVGWAAIVTA